MPNGRSGGFIIEKADLKSLLKTFPNDTVVARIIRGPTRPQPADALETARLVDECPNDQIAVEEQHHQAYVIHLSNEPKMIWLSVGSEAPIFFGLRKRHERWTNEHPDWNGWIAF
jgi:hypothetical protein